MPSWLGIRTEKSQMALPVVYSDQGGPTDSSPQIEAMRSTSSEASAIWGTHLGLTKLVASTSSTPSVGIGGAGGAVRNLLSFPSEDGAGGAPVGLNSHPNTVGGPRAARLLGSGLARVEWGIDVSPGAMEAVVTAYARAGVKIQPLAGFAGDLPTEDEARNLRAWALRFGPNGTFWKSGALRRLAITHIEFGNETSYGYQYDDDASTESYAQRARTYAERARLAARVLQGTGVGLLIQADDGGSKRSTWVDQMFSAVPDLHRSAAGWIVHPYGPSGTDRIKRTIAFLGARGVPVASIRVYVTEWGLASDNGRTLDDNYGYPTDLTYDQAAEILRATLSSWREAFGEQLAQVIIYQDYEPRPGGGSTHREHYFGVLRSNGADKGSYTAEVRRQLTGVRT